MVELIFPKSKIKLTEENKLIYTNVENLNDCFCYFLLKINLFIIFFI